MKQIKFDKDNDIEVLSEEIVHRGFVDFKLYRLRHRLFSGGWSEVLEREVSERKPITAAIPYDPVLDKVVLVEQFRPGAFRSSNAWLLEVVAGVIENDASPSEAIKRELREESGLEANKFHKICEYWVSPGGSNEYLTLYCAEVDASNAGGVHGLPEEHEDIYVHVVSSSQAFKMVKDGTINNALTIIAVQWLELNKSLIQANTSSKG